VPVLIRRLSVLLSVLLFVGVAVVRPTPAVAAADVGYEGPTYTSSAPTGEKPESKAWFNAGFWWASMWDTASSRYEIFKLNTGTQTWSSTNVGLDTRATSKADTLWDGAKLYVSSHVFTTSPASGTPSYLYRFTYTGGTYTLDAGFPATINNYKSESLVIDKDSTGQLWATWTFGSRVYVNRTTTGDNAWGVPFQLPNASQVASDDISSLIAFDGDKIGVFWGDQRGATFRFATHTDTDANDMNWSTVVSVLPGPKSADDHMNLKSLATDSTGRVFAAIKTSKTNSTDPIIQLFVRTKTPSVKWTAYTIWKVSDHLTRPIVLLDTTNNRIHVFASTEGGGKVYEKTSSLSSIGFGSGLGTIVMFDGGANQNGINNSTSTKQNLSSATGLMVLASNDLTKRYWHHYDSLGGGGGNATPVCQAVSATVPQDSSGVDIAPNCADADGPNALTYAISGAAGHGTASINGSSLHYIPTPGYSGGDSFGYTAFDGLATSTPAATVTITITPSGGNATPVCQAVSATVPQDSSGVDIAPNCTDADGPNALTYAISGAAGHGTASINGSSLHYIPTPGYSGGDSFGYTAFDGLATSTPAATVTITVTTAGTPVIANPDADTYVRSDTPTVPHGSDPTLRTRASSFQINSFLRFTVTGAATGSTGEILRLYVTDASIDAGSLYQVVDDSWSESVLWPGPVPGTFIADLGAVAAGGYVDINVSSYVNGNGTYSFAIVGENSDVTFFSSRETANPPQLVVTPS
jgi:hypothetical protein